MADEAEKAARAALLTQIQKQAEEARHASVLKDLALAFALTVGSKWGHLPGGVVDVKVSQ